MALGKNLDDCGQFKVGHNAFEESGDMSIPMTWHSQSHPSKKSLVVTADINDDFMYINVRIR